jgi:hypothetical protein
MSVGVIYRVMRTDHPRLQIDGTLPALVDCWQGLDQGGLGEGLEESDGIETACG